MLRGKVGLWERGSRPARGSAPVGSLGSFFHCEDNPKTFLKKPPISVPPAPARMATRGNPSGDSIAEPSTDLRAMIEDPDHESMDEDPATLDNGKFSYLPLARLPHQKNRRAPAS